MRCSTHMICAAFLTIAGPGLSLAASPASWTLDSASTEITIDVGAIGMSDLHGHFADVYGKLTLDLDKPDSCHVAFRVPTKTLDVGTEALNDYLKSRSVFDTARFTDILFDSKQIEKLDERTAKVTGDLTVVGIIHPLVLTVTIDRQAMNGHERLNVEAKGVVHRLEYGINAGFPAVGNDVRLTVTAAVVR